MGDGRLRRSRYRKAVVELRASKPLSALEQGPDALFKMGLAYERLGRPRQGSPGVRGHPHDLSEEGLAELARHHVAGLAGGSKGSRPGRELAIDASPVVSLFAFGHPAAASRKKALVEVRGTRRGRVDPSTDTYPCSPGDTLWTSRRASSARRGHAKVCPTIRETPIPTGSTRRQHPFFPSGLELRQVELIADKRRCGADGGWALSRPKSAHAPAIEGWTRPGPGGQHQGAGRIGGGSPGCSSRRKTRRVRYADQRRRGQDLWRARRGFISFRRGRSRRAATGNGLPQLGEVVHPVTTGSSGT